MINLHWVKKNDRSDFDFLTVDLDHRHFDNLQGVYIIWHGGANPSVVYVGQGIIRDRLKKHRENPSILSYSNYGLYAVWANADFAYRDGVERYLADQWKPRIGEKHPDAFPITVNSPWQKGPIGKRDRVDCS